MSNFTIEFLIGSFFVALWVVISAICFSRIGTLREDRHHPFASPLVSVKVFIMVLLGLWAFFYGALREFELFSPDSLWHIVPVCMYHIFVAQVLRPIAVMLFCFVISTPALPPDDERRFFEKHENSETRQMQSSNNRLVVISTDPKQKYHTSCLSQTQINNIDEYSSENMNGVDHNYYSISEMGDYDKSKKRECMVLNVLPTVIGSNFKDSLIKPINLEFTGNTSNTSVFLANKPARFSDTAYLQRECFLKKNNKRYFSVTTDRQNGFEAKDEEGFLDLYARRGSSVSDAIPGSMTFNESNEQGYEMGADSTACVSDLARTHHKKTNYKSNLSCCGRVVFYWIIGRIPTIDNNANESLNNVDCWSRLLLWRLALRMRLYIPLWLLTVMTSVILTVYIIKGELHGCFERVSEVGICYSSGIDMNFKARVHIPRGITCLSVVTNSLLLLLWVTCGVDCLRNIRNVITKESFSRTYIMGAFLFALHIIYGCVQLYDQLRYNEIVKVLLFIFENICDSTLVLLLALRLGSGTRQMPRWYKFVKSISLKIFKKSSAKHFYVF